MIEQVLPSSQGVGALSAEAAALERLLAERHSCRAFLPDEVERGTLESIFTMAQRAASWCNSQPWQVTVLSGAATRRVRDAMLNPQEGQLRESDIPFPAEYKGVYLERRRECGFQLYNAVGVPRGDIEGYKRQTSENFRFFGAPHAAIITTEPSLGTYGAVDVGGYVQILLLAMQAHHIGAIAQAALANFSPLLKRLLNIPSDRHVVCGLSAMRTQVTPQIASERGDPHLGTPSRGSVTDACLASSTRADAYSEAIGEGNCGRLSQQ